MTTVGKIKMPLTVGAGLYHVLKKHVYIHSRATICNRLKGAFNERPVNWITPETCEAQYKWLHENHVKLEISCERPTDQILDYLKTGNADSYI